MAKELENGAAEPEADQRGYFRRFLDGVLSCTKSSTAHGVNHVANSVHPIIRMFWLLSFAAGSGIFLFHFYTLINRFQSNPVSIVVDYRAVDFEFPDVTFCPLLPFSIRVLEYHGLLGNLSNITDVKSPEMEAIIEKGGMPFESFLLECRFHDAPCNRTRDFKLVEDPRYKHCYTFAPVNRNAMSTVPRQGLSVVLFTENVHPHSLMQETGFEIPSEWQSSGVRVAIHPPQTHPHPESRGVDVAPATSSLIGLTISGIEQIKGCKNRESVTVCDLHNQANLATFAYVKEDCYTERIQHLMRDNCKCLSDEFQLPESLCRDNTTGEVIGEHYTPICSSSEELKKCHNRFITTINENFANMIISECPYMCREKNWHSSLYSTSWPSHFAENQVARIFETAHKRILESSKNSITYLEEYMQLPGTNPDRLTQNLAHITVYPKVLTGNQERQEAAYPVVSLLGEVGGILGLWLGCSVLTFFEPVELLLHAIIPCCMRHVDNLQQKTVNLRLAVQARRGTIKQANDQRIAFSSAVLKALEDLGPDLLDENKPPDQTGAGVGIEAETSVNVDDDATESSQMLHRVKFNIPVNGESHRQVERPSETVVHVEDAGNHEAEAKVPHASNFNSSIDTKEAANHPESPLPCDASIADGTKQNAYSILS